MMLLWVNKDNVHAAIIVSTHELSNKTNKTNKTNSEGNFKCCQNCVNSLSCLTGHGIYILFIKIYDFPVCECCAPWIYRRIIALFCMFNTQAAATWFLEKNIESSPCFACYTLLQPLRFLKKNIESSPWLTHAAAASVQDIQLQPPRDPWNTKCRGPRSPFAFVPRY